jgi:hypothetical protein
MIFKQILGLNLNLDQKSKNLRKVLMQTDLGSVFLKSLGARAPFAHNWLRQYPCPSAPILALALSITFENFK